MIKTKTSRRTTQINLCTSIGTRLGYTLTDGVNYRSVLTNLNNPNPRMAAMVVSAFRGTTYVGDNVISE